MNSETMIFAAQMDDQIENWLSIELPPEEKKVFPQADKKQPEVESKQPLESRFDQIVKIPGIEQPLEKEKDFPHAEGKHPEARSKQRTEMVITVCGLKGRTVSSSDTGKDRALSPFDKERDQSSALLPAR